MAKNQRTRSVLLLSTSAAAASLLFACASGSTGELLTLEGGAGSVPSLPEGLSSVDLADWPSTHLDGGSHRGHDGSAGDGSVAEGEGGVRTPVPDSGVLTPYDGGHSNLAIHVSGNQLVDATNTPVTLRGANVSNTEFACAQGWTTDPYGGAPLASVSTFEVIRSWNMNVIRLPLNEDCWLDINGVKVGGAAYQSAIAAEVSAAHAAGLFVILDLHWTAPGTQTALAQNPAPDADHSPAFWQSLATMFASDPGVIFDLFNEPFDWWGTNPDPWAGWLNGDTQKQYVTGGTPYQVVSSWQTAGMQQLVDIVRAAGATQPILVNGLDWANDDSGWLSHAPSDSLHQIIAGAHLYPGETCQTPACWGGVFPALGAAYPILIGETGDSVAGPATFLPTFLPYADSQHWSYLAWTWNPWQDPNNILITDYAGTPTPGEGATWKAHLASFPFQN